MKPSDFKPASWIIRNKKTKQVLMETFNRSLVAKLKPEYEAVPILEYLASINGRSS